jgi:type I restriction enzyme, S subunit
MRFPSPWPTVRISDVAEIIRGVTYKKEIASKDAGAGRVPLLRATNIGSELELTAGLVYIPRDLVRASQLLRTGDIVLATSSGSVSVVGKSARLTTEWHGTFGAFCGVLRPNAAIDSRFLALYVLSEPVRSQWSAAARGTNINNLKRGDLEGTPVPLPPPDEQRRIVDILEDHLSRLDAGNSYLSGSERWLAAYEASALSAADEGEEKLLADIANIQGGIQKQPRRAPRDHAFPFLRVANVTAKGLRLDDVHMIELFDGELDRLRLVTGDLLVVEGNGSASQIGRAAVWDGSIPDCVHQNHLIRVRPKPELIPEYLEAVWNSPRHRASLTDVASSSSGLYTLSVSKLARLHLRVPELPRQHEIVSQLRAVRDRRQRLNGQLDAIDLRSDQLRRSLLAAAFSGRLTGHASDTEVIEEMAQV